MLSVVFVITEGDETMQDKRQKAVERARKRALSSNIMKELREEYYEGPEEIVASTCTAEVAVHCLLMEAGIIIMASGKTAILQLYHMA